MGARFTVFLACRPCEPAGWLALLLTKAGDVETNPGPTTLNKKVWICDICHKQIHVRKQISIRCNRIEHWVHLRCAGIRQAQYTDTWTCHLHRESRLTQTLTATTPHPDPTPALPSPSPLSQHTHMQHKQQYMHHSHRNNRTHNIGYYDNLTNRPRTTTGLLTPHKHTGPAVKVREISSYCKST